MLNFSSFENLKNIIQPREERKMKDRILKLNQEICNNKKKIRLINSELDVAEVIHLKT